MMKILFVLLGTISLSFGILGIVIPGLPTTPFLLLSAGLYLRGSEKLYRFITHNKYFGPYILKFRNDKGMTLKSKLIVLLIMWSMIMFSAFFLIPDYSIDIVLYCIGFVGTIVMGFVISTIKLND